MAQPINASATKKRWQPSPAIMGSFALHAAAAAALVFVPRLWPAVVATLIANHALLTAAGLWPRSHLLGPNLTRLPPRAIARNEIAITIDDGPDAEVTPKVLDVLEQYGAQASFFCIGARAQALPQLCAEIVRRGHTVENHTQRHAHSFSFSGISGFRREIATAQQTLQAITGVAPTFFRAPAGLRNPLLEPVLAQLGLQLASWTRRGFDTVTTEADKVAARLTRNLSAGDVLLLHDGHAARTRNGQSVILEVLPRLLDNARKQGLKPVTLRAAML